MIVGLNFIRYSTDPYQLLQRLVNVILRIVEQETSRETGFLCSLADDPDYSPGTLTNVADVLREDVAMENLAPQVEQLMEQVGTTPRHVWCFSVFKWTDSLDVVFLFWTTDKYTSMT